jgi:hypothetical protein
MSLLNPTTSLHMTLKDLTEQESASAHPLLDDLAGCEAVIAHLLCILALRMKEQLAICSEYSNMAVRKSSIQLIKQMRVKVNKSCT